MAPHAGVDANFIGCSIVTQIYSLRQLLLDPFEGACINVTKVEGGQGVAMISDRFEIQGTLRTLSQVNSSKIKSHL